MTQHDYKTHYDKNRASVLQEKPFAKRTKNLHWGLTMWLEQEFRYSITDIVVMVIHNITKKL